MNRVITLIKDATPNMVRPWTAKVIVIEKTTPRDARSSPSKYQRIIVSDSENNKVQVTLFGETINMFKDRLIVYKTYYISNANVKLAPQAYRVSDCPYQWILNPSCLVEDVVDAEIPAAFLTYNFVDIEGLLNYKDSNSPIDMLVVVLKLLPVKNITTRDKNIILQEVVVTDKSLRPIILTLWDHFVTNDGSNLESLVYQKPTLAAVRVKVVVYDGLSIGSRSTSAFLVNPPMQSSVHLQAWVFNNIALLNALALSEDLIPRAHAFGRSAIHEITTLANVQVQPQNRLFYVKCNLQLVDLSQEIVRNICNSCNRPTTAQNKELYTCNFCGKNDAFCVTSLRVETIATDVTGSLTIFLYGQDACVLFNCNYDEIIRSQLMVPPQPISSIVKSEFPNECGLQLKAYNHSYNGLVTRRYIATFIPNTTESAAPLAPVYNTQTCSRELEELLESDDDIELSLEEKQVIEAIRARKAIKKTIGAAAVNLVSAPSASSSGNDELTDPPSDLEAGDSHEKQWDGLSKKTDALNSPDLSPNITNSIMSPGDRLTEFTTYVRNKRKAPTDKEVPTGIQRELFPDTK